MAALEDAVDREARHDPRGQPGTRPSRRRASDEQALDERPRAAAPFPEHPQLRPVEADQSAHRRLPPSVAVRPALSCPASIGAGGLIRNGRNRAAGPAGATMTTSAAARSPPRARSPDRSMTREHGDLLRGAGGGSDMSEETKPHPPAPDDAGRRVRRRRRGRRRASPTSRRSSPRVPSRSRAITPWSSPGSPTRRRRSASTTAC